MTWAEASFSSSSSLIVGRGNRWDPCESKQQQQRQGLSLMTTLPLPRSIPCMLKAPFSLGHWKCNRKSSECIQFNFCNCVSPWQTWKKNILCNAISVNLCFKAYFLLLFFILKDLAVLCFTLDGSVCPCGKWWRDSLPCRPTSKRQRQRRTKRREACQGKTEGISYVSSNMSLY